MKQLCPFVSRLDCNVGDNYVDNLEVRECLTPLELCRGHSHLNVAQLIVRCILLGCASIWHIVLVYHSIRDMAHTPHTSFRYLHSSLRWHTILPHNHMDQGATDIHGAWQHTKVFLMLSVPCHVCDAT